MMRQTPEEMYHRCMQGDTLREIGQDNHISGERVRQLIHQYEMDTGAESAMNAYRARQRAIVEQAELARQEHAKFKKMFREEQDEYISRLSTLGKTEVEIAEMLDIDRGIVCRSLIRQRGRIKNKSENVSDHTLAIWRGLADAGVTQSQIAKQSGYTQGEVSRVLKRRT